MAFKVRRWRIYACLKIEFSNSKVSLLYFWKVKSFHLGMLIKEEKVKVAQNRLRHLINVRSTSFHKKETKNHSIYEMIGYLNLFYKNCSNMGLSCQIMQVYHLHRIKKGATGDVVKLGRDLSAKIDGWNKVKFDRLMGIVWWSSEYQVFGRDQVLLL